MLMESIIVHKTLLELSDKKGVAAFSKTTKVDGDLFVMVSRSPEPREFSWIEVLYTCFKAEIFAVAAELSVHPVWSGCMS